MVSVPTLLHSVKNAYADTGAPRVLALALLRRAFVGSKAPPATGQTTSTPHSEPPTLPEYGEAWRKLHQPARTRSNAELDLASALARRADAEAILLLAAMARLPAQAAERVLLGPDAEALLILGRATNLAWSTMRALIAMRERLAPARPGDQEEAPLSLDKVAIEFDEFPRPVAERALRFIRAFAVAMTQTA